MKFFENTITKLRVIRSRTKIWSRGERKARTGPSGKPYTGGPPRLRVVILVVESRDGVIRQQLAVWAVHDDAPFHVLLHNRRYVLPIGPSGSGNIIFGAVRLWRFTEIQSLISRSITRSSHFPCSAAKQIVLHFNFQKSLLIRKSLSGIVSRC